jgi:hypothetical protein
MEDKDLKYKQVLDKLKKTEPVLDDAEALVDRIMHRVEQTTVRSGQVKVIRILGYLSGVAASALICLFAFETLNYPTTTEGVFSKIQSVTTARNVGLHNLGELEKQEKTKIIKNILKKRETQRVRKERWSTVFIAYKRELKHY